MLVVKILTVLVIMIPNSGIFAEKIRVQKLLTFFSKNISIYAIFNDQGPVVQSIVSLTSSLRVISLTLLVDSIHNILIFFAEKM